MNKDKSILIIDDSNSNVDFLFNILGEDYQIYVATDGKSALMILEKIIPDMILLDWILPDTTGGKLLKKIRNNPKLHSIDVFLISGVQDEKILDELEELDIKKFIPKPLDAMKLKQEIDTFLAQKKRPGPCLELKWNSALAESYFLLGNIIHSNRGNEYSGKSSPIPLIAVALGKKMNLSSEDCMKLYFSIPLRDLGMIYIPDSILNKKEALNFQEWEMIQDHTIKGAACLKSQNNPILFTSSEIALNHHEHWDGNGYPQKLSGEEIPFLSRITSILDTLEALLSQRPYRKPQKFNRVLDIILSVRGTQFDPYMVNKLMEISSDIERIHRGKDIRVLEAKLLKDLL